MPIIDKDKTTSVHFGYGDVSITLCQHPLKKVLFGINLIQMSKSTVIGEEIDEVGSIDKKSVNLEFGKLASLDLFIQQLKLLRGSQADGESLKGEIVFLLDDQKEAEFIRVMDGDENRCILKLEGKYIEKNANDFVFKNSSAEGYFINFFGITTK